MKNDRLFIVWKSMTARMLPPVLLYIQVNRIVPQIIKIMKPQIGV